MVGKSGGGADRVAVDAALPGRRKLLADGRIDAGAERGKPEHALDLGRNSPAAIAFGKGELLDSGAAQAAARRQQRDRLDQVGFAGAIRAGEHHRARGDKLNLRGVIAAEVGEGEAAQISGGHAETSSQ
jgi:hypothetical protein